MASGGGAAAGAGAGLTTLILDTDPQATASHWSEWRGSSDLEVVDCASPALLPRKLQQAAELGADLVVLSWNRSLAGGHGRVVRRVLEAGRAPTLLLP